MGTNWKNNKALLNEAAAPRRLGDELEAWRKALMKQLPKKAYNELTPRRYEAWSQWLSELRNDVRALSSENGDITRGAECIVSHYVFLAAANGILSALLLQLAGARRRWRRRLYVLAAITLLICEETHTSPQNRMADSMACLYARVHFHPAC